MAGSSAAGRGNNVLSCALSAAETSARPKIRPRTQRLQFARNRPEIEALRRPELRWGIKVACTARIELRKHSNFSDFRQALFWGPVTWRRHCNREKMKAQPASGTSVVTHITDTASTV